MKLEPAISANPFISFPVRVDQSGTFDFSGRRQRSGL